MTTKISLQIVGRDMFDESVDETMDQVLDYAVLVSERGPIQLLSIFVDDEDAIEAAIEVARKIEDHIEGAQVVAVDRDPVTLTEISTRVGVSREAVRKWSSAKGFPAPDGYLESPKMLFWSWTKIVGWLDEVKSIDMDESLPSTQQFNEIDRYLTRQKVAKEVQWHNIAPRKHASVFEPSQFNVTPVTHFTAVSTARGGSQGSPASRALVGATAVL